MDSSILIATILDWHSEIDRNLPWKYNSSPYKIWISEIILQQTQVVQGLRYYERFVDRYPTVHDLASSTESDLLKVWEGLGYNSRARYLHQSAKRIVDEFGGKFPVEYSDILSLKGVGDYTASAISAFAYEQPHVAVDSNVERWVSRYYGIASYKSSQSLKTEVKSILLPVVEKHESPAECNQAFIDFGALVCTAKQPKCIDCPLSQTCYGYAQSKTADYPLVKPKVPRKKRYFHYLVAVDNGHVVINKRLNKDIWQGMHEFPLYESDSLQDLTHQDLCRYFDINESTSIESIISYQQILTHRIIIGKFYLCKLKRGTVKIGQWMSVDQVKKIAVAGIVRLYLADNMFIFNDINKIENGK